MDALREDEQSRTAGKCPVQQFLHAVGPRGRYAHHARVIAPVAGGDHRSVVGAETDQYDAFRGVAFANELAETDHSGRRHVGGPSVSDMGVVCPHHSLRVGTMVLHEPVEGVSHVVVTDVPGLRAAAHHGPVVAFGAGQHFRVLPCGELHEAAVCRLGVLRELPQPHQQGEDFALATGRHEPGGVCVGAGIPGVRLEAAVRLQCARRLGRGMFVEVADHGVQRLPQRVDVQAEEAHA